MNIRTHAYGSNSITRWLVAAGVAAGLLVPLSARADHQGNGVVEVLASAAVAYVVIDAVGGFDDGRDRRHRRHRHDSHHDRYDRHGDRDRRYWARYEHGRQERLSHSVKHHRKHEGHGHAYGKRQHGHRHGHSHGHRRDGRHRYRAYH